jgi:hypothetical protein
VLLAALIIAVLPFYVRVRQLADPARLLDHHPGGGGGDDVDAGQPRSAVVHARLHRRTGPHRLSGGALVVFPERAQATNRYLQFQGVGVLLLLAGTLTVGWTYHDTTGLAWTFDLLALAGQPVPQQIGVVAFFLLFYGLGIRTPIFPFHGWLRPVALHGDMAVAPTLLLGVKVGVYGHGALRPAAAARGGAAWQPYVVVFAVAGVFYAALLALLQRQPAPPARLRRGQPYQLVIIGLFSLDAARLPGQRAAGGELRPGHHHAAVHDRLHVPAHAHHHAVASRRPVRRIPCSRMPS